MTIPRQQGRAQALRPVGSALMNPAAGKVFPDSGAVNRALRVLAEAAQTAGASKRRRSR